MCLFKKKADKDNKDKMVEYRGRLELILPIDSSLTDEELIKDTERRFVEFLAGERKFEIKEVTRRGDGVISKIDFRLRFVDIASGKKPV